MARQLPLRYNRHRRPRKAVCPRARRRAGRDGRRAQVAHRKGIRLAEGESVLLLIGQAGILAVLVPVLMDQRAQRQLLRRLLGNADKAAAAGAETR